MCQTAAMEPGDPCTSPPSARSPASTFVLRFWQERRASGLGWRGRIEHVQSGQSAAFLRWEEMLAFLERFGVMGSPQAPLEDEG